MNRFIAYLLCVMLITTTAGCGKKDADKKRSGAIPVKVMKVRAGTLNRMLEYVGNIKGIDEAIVYPKVSGKIIEKVKEDGAPVKKGDIIAYIDRDEVGLTFEKAPVESPLTGVVGRVYVDIGASVNVSSPVALVTNMSTAQIELSIPEQYVPKLSLGQRADVTVDAYPGMVFEGNVSKISPVIDLETRAAPIEIMIKNDKGYLQSGMFADVKLIIDKNENIPIVIKEAIMGKSPNYYVYVVEGYSAKMRKVTLGIRQGSEYEIKEGLSAGDYVVIMGQQKLRDGAEVLAEE